MSKVVLVCGGRDFNDWDSVCAHLDQVEAGIVIQGGARGADALAKRWAAVNGIHCAEVPAMWSALGKSAGPARNKAMLALKPDLVVAFPGGNGTAHMKRVAREAGVRVWDLGEDRITLTPAGREAYERAMTNKLNGEVKAGEESNG